ncbi:MAG: hypothetical protein H7301_11670, partial [Cryobacterium sp.]|nr:hypothetical protein [Oligoflexia bacterium]
TNPLASTGAIIGFRSGGAKTITGPGGTSVQVGSIQGLVKFLQTNTNGTVLATPQILTLDNTEATFESAEKIPVPTSNASANGVVSSGTTKEDVSISIKLKPAINKLSNYVKLDVEAKLQDISQRQLPKAVQDQAFAILSRTTKTSVVVGDGDTVVLGGLVRDKASETTVKVPILGDIPVLGWLFKSRTQQTEKTNLLIFITPKIIRQYEGIRTVLDQKLKERDDFLEKSMGGIDIGREFRDKIVRSLPDIKKIQNVKPQTSFTIDNSPDGSMSMDENSGNAYNGSRGSNQSQAPSAPPPVNQAPGTGNYMPSTDLPPPPTFNGGDQS